MNTFFSLEELKAILSVSKWNQPMNEPSYLWDVSGEENSSISLLLSLQELLSAAWEQP